MRRAILSLCVACLAASGPACAQGDAAAGEAVFAKCQGCHTVVAGRNLPTGPNLLGVVGRKAASVDFACSDAMAKAGAKGLVWDERSMSRYLKDPKAFLAAYLGRPTVDNAMLFQLKSAKERTDVIAYLKSLN